MTRNNTTAGFGSLIKSEGKQTEKYYLGVPEVINGSCRAVSQFDVKNRDVLAAAQFAGQSVTAVLPQNRHPAREVRKSRTNKQILRRSYRRPTLEHFARRHDVMEQAIGPET